jgi:hypothetical protein
MPQLAAIARELDTLVSMLHRMPLSSHKAPEAPHEARSEICRGLASIADRIRGQSTTSIEAGAESRRPVRVKQPARAIAQLGIRGVVVGDRIVPVELRRPRR